MKIIDNGIIREMTAQEEAAFLNVEIPVEFEIQSLKQMLADTDYKAVKYAEGWLTEAEYADVKEKRQAWRERINELEDVCNDRFH
jgi:hypothetical protein